MNTKEALEKAIKAGYSKEQRCTALGILKPIEAILLDSEFWIALGESEGWSLEIKMRGNAVLQSFGCDYLYRKHKMIDHITDGKTLGEAFDLATK